MKKRAKVLSLSHMYRKKVGHAFFERHGSMCHFIMDRHAFVARLGRGGSRSTYAVAALCLPYLLAYPPGSLAGVRLPY